MPRVGRVLLLTGPPGAGKTTAARLIATHAERGVHVEADRFFEAIVSGYIEPWRAEAHEQNIAVMSVVADVAAGYALPGYFTVVEGIISPRWFLRPLQDRLRSAGVPTAYAVIRPSLATCLTRVSRRGRRPLSERPAVEQLWGQFAQLGDLENHLVDAENCSPEQTAEMICAGLDGRLLLP